MNHPDESSHRPAPDAGGGAGAGAEVPADAESSSLPAPGRGVKQLAAQEFSLAESIGGVRGLVESVAPGLAFVVVFITSRDLTWALIISIALAVATAIGRLITRGSLAHVFGGLIGVGIGAIWAWRTGQAEDYFVWGLYVNAAMALGMFVSILARRPLVGVVVTALFGHSGQWRRNPRAMRLYTIATCLWLATFVARLAVQLPLYLNSSVGWLGTARLVMGIPLWALVLYLTWLLVHSLVRAEDSARSDQDTEADATGPADRQGTGVAGTDLADPEASSGTPLGGSGGPFGRSGAHLGGSAEAGGAAEVGGVAEVPPVVATESSDPETSEPDARS